MTSDDKITHSIICEHTRRLAAHDKSTSPVNRKMVQQKVTVASRLKEFNRSRRVLLANGLSLKRTVTGLPDNPKQ
jgi:hypothetical protein